MRDITSLPTQRISDERHKLALRLLRELQDKSGEVTIQGDIATEKTRAIHPVADEPVTPAIGTKVVMPAIRQVPVTPPLRAEAPTPKLRKRHLLPFLSVIRQKLAARQEPPSSSAELSADILPRLPHHAQPSNSYVLIPIPVRTNAPYAGTVLGLYPRSYKHVYLLIDGKRSITDLTLMKRCLGEQVIEYIVGQLEKAGMVKVTHRVELRTDSL